MIIATVGALKRVGVKIHFCRRRQRLRQRLRERWCHRLHPRRPHSCPHRWPRQRPRPRKCAPRPRPCPRSHPTPNANAHHQHQRPMPTPMPTPALSSQLAARLPSWVPFTHPDCEYLIKFDRKHVNMHQKKTHAYKRGTRNSQEYCIHAFSNTF